MKSKKTKKVTLRASPLFVDPTSDVVRGRRDIEKEKSESCQLYKQYDEDGRLLYVGISRDAMSRTGQHAKAPWAHRVAKVEIATFPTRQRALNAETWHIQSYRPIFNRRKKIALMTNGEVGKAVGFTLAEAYRMAKKGERLNSIDPVEFETMTAIERRKHNRELTRLARKFRHLRERISPSEMAFLE